MADQPTVRIKLTREQEMDLLAATGQLVGSLELCLEELEKEAIPRVILPERDVETEAWAAPRPIRPR